MHDHFITVGELIWVVALFAAPVYLLAAAAQAAVLRRARVRWRRAAATVVATFAGAVVLTPVMWAVIPDWAWHLWPLDAPFHTLTLATLLASAVATPLATAAALRGRAPVHA